MTSRSALLLALVTIACSGRASSEPPDAAPTPIVCPAGEVAVEGSCATRFDTCGESEIPIPGGGCTRVGIPEGGCAKGFRYDAARASCEPMVPSARCGPGTMAVPGDVACRPIGSCGDGTWGAIPIEPDTVFVDATQIGGDGTKARPYTTIGAAIAAHPVGIPMIAIAAGTYREVITSTRSLRLWGRCPSMVTIEPPAGDATGWVVAMSASFEMHGIAITGPSEGIAIDSATSALLDEVWVHDVGSVGVKLYAGSLDTTLIIRRSLIEKATGFGVSGGLASVTIDSSAVRATRPLADASAGFGILLQHHARAKKPELLRIVSSVIEDTRTAAIETHGIALEMEGSLVRGTRPQLSTKTFGRAVSVAHSGELRGKGSVVASVLEQNEGVGLIAQSSDVIVERTLIRGTVRNPLIENGQALVAATKSTVRCTECVIDDNHSGVTGFGSSLHLIRTAVRGSFGKDGVHVQPVEGVDQPAYPTELTIESCLIRGGALGALIVVGAKASVDRSLLESSRASLGGDDFGDGIAVGNAVASTEVATIPASLVLTYSRIRDHRRAGVSIFAASAILEGNQIECTGFDIELSRSVINSLRLADPSLEDRGKNSCGCGGTLRTCKAQSSGLEPVKL